MCGIAGWFGQVDNPVPIAEGMMQRLRHRGPDQQQYRLWPTCGLVHTRLSILDLSPSGAQPMANESATVWTVFNGEIYNFQALKGELETKGHAFRGSSDTEILPHLYEDEGPNFLPRLRGMFAWAIYDGPANTLVLARDRFGIKPLFYASAGNTLFFASELNALAHVPGIDRSPDPQAIHDFAALCFIPAPATFFRGVRALEPGCYLTAHYEAGVLRVRIRQFHRWCIAPNPGLDLPEATQQAATELHASVRSQLRSDVPLGTLLSGGIDSSLVSAAAQDGARGALQTFNVRFPNADYDETWAAQAVSRHIGSRHLTLDLKDFYGSWENVVGLLRHAGQPFADTSVFAVNAISRIMRQHITVALSGDGGDEGFGGYKLYSQIAWFHRYRSLPGFCRHWITGTLQWASGRRWIDARLAERVAQLTDADDTGILETTRCWIRPAEQGALCGVNGLLPVRRFFEPQWERQLPAGANGLERLSALATEIDSRLLLPNDFLFKVDLASMRESLEVRVPMLDESLFALGMQLPHALKAQAGETKRVLRAVAMRQLPLEVVRKPKHGFDVPMDDWLTAECRAELRTTLLAPHTRLRDVLNPRVFTPWVEAFCDRRPVLTMSRQGLHQRVFMLLALHLSLEPSAA